MLGTRKEWLGTGKFVVGAEDFNGWTMGNRSKGPRQPMLRAQVINGRGQGNECSGPSTSIIRGRGING